MSSESVHIHPGAPFGRASAPSSARLSSRTAAQQSGHAAGHPTAPTSTSVSVSVSAHSSERLPEHPALRPSASVTGALRAVESFLLRGGRQTARRNAWAAVVEDRQRARDRREAQYEMDALVSGMRANAALRD